MNQSRFALVWMGAVLSLLGCGGSSCSGSREKNDLPFERSAQSSSVDSLWDDEFPGPITDLAIAETSGDLVAASIPDIEGGGKHFLTLMGKNGKKIFQVTSPYPVKSLDVAADGSRIVVNNYEGKLVAYDRAGQIQWQSEGGCKPIILNAPKKILCFHDDDTKPSFAFDLYDFEGKRTYRFPTKLDVLNLKVSNDERWLAASFAGGRALVFNLQEMRGEAPKIEREHRVTGEILDLGISNGDEPKLAAIAMDVKKGESLFVFDAKKGPISSIRLSYHVEQLEIFPTGRLIAVYGNSPRGQYLAVHSAYDATLQWQRLEPRYADYSLAIRVGQDRILAGFEQLSTDSAVKTRNSRIVVLDLDGKMRADLPLKTAEGAYLYSFAYSPDSSLLGVGTDDKKLRLYELK
jgi:WD40 repeat protein